MYLWMSGFQPERASFGREEASGLRRYAKRREAWSIAPERCKFANRTGGLEARNCPRLGPRAAHSPPGATEKVHVVSGETASIAGGGSASTP
jgi:hypothetical protein